MGQWKVYCLVVNRTQGLKVKNKNKKSKVGKNGDAGKYSWRPAALAY